MEVFVKIAQFVLSLSILVVCHEMGHFLFAKLFKTRVEKFYVFFNPWFSLFKWKHKETEYGIGWLPLGGYVKIAGMMDESMDTAQLQQPPQPWEFRSKPAWQRLLIMVGGVMVNVLVAFMIYVAILYTWGETYLPAKNVTHGVVCAPMFQRMGLQNGDRIVALDGREPERFSGIISDILLNNPRTMQVVRGGDSLTLRIPETLVGELLDMSSRSFKLEPLLEPRRPVEDGLRIAQFAEGSVAEKGGLLLTDRILMVNGQPFAYYDEFTELVEKSRDSWIQLTVLRGADTVSFGFMMDNTSKLGIYAQLPRTYELATRKFTLWEAIPAGVRLGCRQIASYVRQLKLLFSQGGTAVKSVGGFATIANVFPGMWNWMDFWSLTAMISIMLAVVNILPIPALDGGHVLFLLYEVVTRRKPGDKFMEYAQVAGMVFVFSLFILANVNDILKFIGL